jgi:Cu(I)/Ag(I) efflux system membrane protein CusA/SilA
MIARLIHACIANRVLVLVAAALLAVVGIWSVKNTPLDALPDLSDTQVIIRTQWAGQTRASSKTRSPTRWPPRCCPCRA